VSDGHRELIITGVNVGTYNDNGRTLVDVVDSLEEIDGLERVRLSSIEPTTIDEKLVDRMARGGKLCPYLHIPLQSGDDGVLARMRRKYTSAAYREFIDLVTNQVPEVGLGTDVIVGFPGESQRAFESTCRFVEEIPFTNIHVFSFSARERTGAHGLADRVPGDVIGGRSKMFHKIAHAKKSEFYNGQKGRLLHVLFEERDDGERWVGFSDNYVKVGVETAGDISNRMGVVRISGIANPREKDHKRLVASGDLLEVEDTSIPLAARTPAADKTS
jgi:threonylcarbamoyladenosine tRNA methylthiotransferase MtaB